MEREYLERAEALMSFIAASPSPYHVVDNAVEKLEKEGFIRLSENKPFKVERGKSYFVERASSALIAFKVPQNPKQFRIIASHTDSPCFKIKWNPEIHSEGMPTRLNSESYGGLLLYSWFDRPLSLAGRVFYKEDGVLKEKHIDAKERLSLIIPSLCIHQNRDANDGWKISKQKEMLPLFSDSDVSFLKFLSEECGTEEKNIVDYDLYLYNRTEGLFSGENNEYFSSPRIDDSECAYASIVSLIASNSQNSITLSALFDNEETGSGTRQGALSDFLTSVIDRITISLGFETEEKYIAVSSSFMLSADNGHAVHPSYPEKSDRTNHPRMNGGVLIKYASSQKYTTSGETGAFTKLLLDKNGIPYQIFFNNSDLPGGSTLGNLSTEKISIRTCDVGCAQLAMHSSYETAGVKDVKYLEDFFSSFFSD